jgi:hypothetical protein
MYVIWWGAQMPFSKSRALGRDKVTLKSMDLDAMARGYISLPEWRTFSLLFVSRLIHSLTRLYLIYQRSKLAQTLGYEMLESAD